jgi:predicted TPR repeat methyltransferase
LARDHFKTIKQEENMDCTSYDISYPRNACELDQNEEYIILKNGLSYEKILLHDYRKLYKFPGLYEEILYRRLQCGSPQMLCGLLSKALDHNGGWNDHLRVLDFGAGNGMAGECLKKGIGCETIVGVDILKQAKEAAFRDRPDLYDDYIVADFMNIEDVKKSKLERYDLNVLMTVAALGYDHISNEAFLKAFDVVSKDAWVVFNIKDRFLSEKDDTGFRETVQSLVQRRLQVFESKRYVHRLSMAYEPLYYIGIVGKKNELRRRKNFSTT